MILYGDEIAGTCGSREVISAHQVLGHAILGLKRDDGRVWRVQQWEADTAIPDPTTALRDEKGMRVKVNHHFGQPLTPWISPKYTYQVVRYRSLCLNTILGVGNPALACAVPIYTIETRKLGNKISIKFEPKMLPTAGLTCVRASNPVDRRAWGWDGTGSSDFSADKGRDVAGWHPVRGKGRQGRNPTLP